MLDFNEEQHPRDERGRFAGGGLGGFTAKHTGQLKGYKPSKPEGGLDKWAGKVSGRARDIEVPLVRKGDDDFASTGNMPVNAATYEHVETMLRKTIGTQAGGRFKNALEEFQSAERSYKAQERATTKLKAALPATPTDKDAKKLAKSEAKLAAAKERADKAYAANREETERSDVLNTAIDTLQNAFAKEPTESYESHLEKEGAWNSLKSRHNPLKLEAWKNSGVTMNVQVDRKDGTVDVHLAGVSHDPKYPGEKELHYTITPEKITDTKDAWDPTQQKGPPHTEPRRITIQSQYPSDEKGKPHPHEALIEGSGIGAQSSAIGDDALREHALKFLNS